MPKIDVTALEAELNKGVIRPLYVIVGEEPYLVHEAVSEVKNHISGGDESGLSTASFSVRDARAEDVECALKNISLIGGRPTVFLRDGDQLAKDGNSALLAVLTSYAEAPGDGSVLIVTAEKIDGRTKFMQNATKTGAVVDCKKMFDDRLPSWVGAQVRKAGRQISQEAARFMADMIGNDLGQLKGAIDRVLLYIGSKPAIALQDVEEAVADTHQRDVFDLTDAVGQRKSARALSYLHNLIENGQPPVLILHMLARHFRILCKAREISGRLADKGEAAKYLGVNPYYVGGYLDQARNFSRSELRNGFRIFHRCDREIKSSRLPKERVLERAIMQITQQARR